MRSYFHAIVVVSALAGCARPNEKIPPANMQEAPRKIVIYQMMTRLFGNKASANRFYGTLEENGVGKFSDVTPAALRGIRELGATHVWYTGIIEHASLTGHPAFGIQPDDADVVKGRAGSPYAIRDYYDVDPDLADDVGNRMGEFEDMVRRTHEQGLKVIIDFVPNHVARGYRSDARPPGVKDLGEGDDTTVSFHPDNNFYYLPGEEFHPPTAIQAPAGVTLPGKDGKFTEVPAKATGNDEFTASPGPLSWYETVKLNYGVDIQGGRTTHFDPIPDTWKKMRDILLFWANKDVDGFRCDMAEMVPVEFWAWVIPQVKAAKPGVIFIAEIYNPPQYRNYIENGGFDFLYDKVLLYDMLRFLTTGKRTTLEIDSIQHSLEGIRDHMLHFMENHDEQRMASRFFAGDPWRGIPAMTVSATIDQGPVMIYFGQEVGEPGLGAEGFQGDDGRTTIFDYWGVPEHQKWMNGGKFDGGRLSPEQQQLRRFYGELLTLASTNEAIAQGAYADITAHNVHAGNFPPKVHAFLRYHGDERLVIINSFSEAVEHIKVQIPGDLFIKMGLQPEKVYIARDLLWKEVEVGFDRSLAFELTLRPFSSCILKIK